MTSEDSELSLTSGVSLARNFRKTSINNPRRPCVNIRPGGGKVSAGFVTE